MIENKDKTLEIISEEEVDKYINSMNDNEKKENESIQELDRNIRQMLSTEGRKINDDINYEDAKEMIRTYIKHNTISLYGIARDLHVSPIMADKILMEVLKEE